MSAKESKSSFVVRPVTCQKCVEALILGDETDGRTKRIRNSEATEDRLQGIGKGEEEILGEAVDPDVISKIFLHVHL
jgi:hypothetical protein